MDETKDVAVVETQGTTDVVESGGSMHRLNMELAKSIADELMKVVDFKAKQGQPIVQKISGKLYPMAPCWQIVGAQLQVYPHVEWTTPESPEEIEAQFKAGTLTVKARQVLKTFGGVEVGAGEAICSQAETRWDKDASTYVPRWTDAFQIVSMAQTRALGKAFRNSFGWVIQLAGMEATPAEEMSGNSTEQTHDEPASKTATDMADSFPVMGRDRMVVIMQTSSTAYKEEELRVFVWSAAIELADGNLRKAMDTVNSWGTFKGDKGNQVPGPMPWQKKRDGSMMMAGKWLHNIVNKAKKDLAESES